MSGKNKGYLETAVNFFHHLKNTVACLMAIICGRHDGQDNFWLGRQGHCNCYPWRSSTHAWPRQPPRICIDTESSKGNENSLVTTTARLRGRPDSTDERTRALDFCTGRFPASTAITISTRLTGKEANGDGGQAIFTDGYTATIWRKELIDCENHCVLDLPGIDKWHVPEGLTLGAVVLLLVVPRRVLLTIKSFS